MNFGILIVFFAMLIVVSFIRSRPRESPTTMVDRLFVGLVVFGAMLPAGIAGPLMQRSTTTPWIECVAFLVATVVVGFSPFAVAQVVYRLRVGRWWTPTAHANTVA